MHFLEIWSKKEDAYFLTRNTGLHSTYTRYTVYRNYRYVNDIFTSSSFMHVARAHRYNLHTNDTRLRYPNIRNIDVLKKMKISFFTKERRYIYINVRNIENCLMPRKIVYPYIDQIASNIAHRGRETLLCSRANDRSLRKNGLRITRRETKRKLN